MGSTSEPYVEMLRNFLHPQLLSLWVNMEEMWFQQDGATAHTARASMTGVWQLFLQHVVSRFGDFPWPPRSPDLSACDFFLWGYLKSKVYVRKPRTVDDLKVSICEEIATVPQEIATVPLEIATVSLEIAAVPQEIATVPQNCNCATRNCNCATRNCSCATRNCNCATRNCSCATRNCNCDTRNCTVPQEIATVTQEIATVTRNCNCATRNCNCATRNCNCATRNVSKCDAELWGEAPDACTARRTPSLRYNFP